MGLSAGTRLGTYEILAPLGAGGMGEVYRARDTKLDRQVAIKILPEAVAADADRVARFEREAKALAALNHPNIAAIYGMEQNGFVMELVEGEDLSGPLPLDTALDYARQIADGLEAAHDHGIVHRDLKPGNIRVTPSGTIKILDFGLAAKGAAEGAPRDGGMADSPTLTIRATQAGVILGTASYMSPEQAAGRPVDKRADIWSFGVVLWEMLCGRRLFEGETVSHTLADVLRSDIDFGKLPAETPAAIRELLARCLDRDPRTRLRDIGEVRVAIQRWQANPAAPTPPVRRRPGRTWAVAAVAAGLAAVAGYLMHRPAATQQPVLLEMNPPPGEHIPYPAALSPDGRTVAFFSGEPGKVKLLLRSLDPGEVRKLDVTDGYQMPFWSPDGKYLGYFSASKATGSTGTIYKIPLAGGPPQRVGEVPVPTHAAWGSGDVILVSQSTRGALYRLPATGGTAKEATVLDTAHGETSHRWPSFLPDGRHFLYFGVSSSTQTGGIYMGSLDSTERVKVTDTLSNAQYAAGRLLYVRDQNLVAQPFDPASGRLSGEPIPLLARIGIQRLIYRGDFSVANNGTLIARAGQARRLQQLTWFDHAGRRLETVGAPDTIANPTLSPDGRKLIFSGSGPEDRERTLFLLDLERGILSPWSKGQGTAAFSADGAEIAFADRNFNVVMKGVDGGKETTWKEAADFHLQPGEHVQVADWSHDGRYLAVFVGLRLAVLPIKGGEPAATVDGAFGGKFSPDGKWLAVTVPTSAEDSELYLQSLGGGTARIQVSPAGGRAPHWRADGKELFYVSRDNMVMAVPVRAGSGSPVGIPAPLFEAPGGATFDVTPDGKRFLMTMPLTPSIEPPISVLINWPAMLSR